MSIINDALKKVQRNLDKDKKKDAAPKDIKKDTPKKVSPPATPSISQKPKAEEPTTHHPQSTTSKPSIPESTPPKSSIAQSLSKSQESSSVAPLPPEQKKGVISAASPQPTAKDQPKRKRTAKETALIVFCLLISALLLFSIVSVIKIYKTATVPVVMEEEVVEELTEGLIISGVVNLGDKEVVLVNDEIYEVGASINEDVRILEIGFDYVEFLVGTKVKRIKVNKDLSLE